MATPLKARRRTKQISRFPKRKKKANPVSKKKLIRIPENFKFKKPLKLVFFVSTYVRGNEILTNFRVFLRKQKIQGNFKLSFVELHNLSHVSAFQRMSQLSRADLIVADPELVDVVRKRFPTASKAFESKQVVRLDEFNTPDVHFDSLLNKSVKELIKKNHRQ